MSNGEQKEGEKVLLKTLGALLPAVNLTGTKLVIGSTWPRTIQVIDESGPKPVPVVSITLRAPVPPVPPAKQPPLRSVAAPFAAESTPKGPALDVGDHSFRALNLSVVEVRDSMLRLAPVCPRVGWHAGMLERFEAIVGAADVERLRRHYAGREDVLFVRPFEPDAERGIVLEIFGEGETQSDLANLLAAEFSPGGKPRISTRHGEPVAELPRSTSERDLAWAVGYLLESGVAWSAREQAAPRPRGGARKAAQS